MENANILTEIDLSRTTREGGAGLDTEHSYVVLYNGEWYRGRFSRQWYGLNFEGGPYPVGVQYNPPDMNYSQWQKVYLIDTTQPKTWRRSADSLLIMAGLDPDQIRADEELPMAHRLRTHAISAKLTSNGQTITEAAPLEAFMYEPTVPPMPALEETEE